MNELTVLQQYVVPMTIAFCLVVGQLMKQVPKIHNKHIPLIVALLGLLFNIWVNNLNITPLVVLQGLASGLASTGTFELIKGILKKDKIELTKDNIEINDDTLGKK